MHAELREPPTGRCMQEQSTPLVITSTSYHTNAEVERPLLNSEIDRFGSQAEYGSDLNQN